MKKWILVVAVAFAVIVVGLLAASAFAYSSSQQSFPQYGPNSLTSSPRIGGGMMGGGYGGNSYSAQSASNVNGHGGCMGGRSLP
jgi:hypothetical protein